MRKQLLILTAFLLSFLFCQPAFGQFKIHSNGRMTLQSTVNSADQGITIEPYPSWTTTINGDVHFVKQAFFRKVTGAYGWMTSAIANNEHSAAWVVSPDWNTVNYVVYGKGTVYSKGYFIISQSQNGDSKGEGADPIEGTEALKTVLGLNGYYFAPEETEIPDLENNDNVQPEAVEAMYADFGKRSVGLSGIDFPEAFPEGVRTDPQNRLCINYSSVVTMLVEAVKEQQREIEELRKTLKDNGLLKP